MPILELEIVADDSLPDGLTSRIADAAGCVFNASAGTTWVRLRTLRKSQYAENGSGTQSDFSPVFVSVLMYEWPPAEQMKIETAELAAEIAELCDKPVENVHILYIPEAKGRIAFGGKLLSDT